MPPVDAITPADIDPEIEALMAETRSWFEDGPIEQYYMTAGGMGQLTQLTLSAATFDWVNNGDPARHYPDRKENFADLIHEATDRNANSAPTPVDDQTEAQATDGIATWKTISSGQKLFIHERVPFDHPITTFDELQAELSSIMHRRPDFDELHRKLQAVK